MVLKDSGTRREFKSGAVRDVAEGKGRCDLLPLYVIGTIENDAILRNIGKFIYEGDVELIISTIKLFYNVVYKTPYDAWLKVAKHYEDGAKKYDARNWEKGIPAHCYVDSGVRHYLKFMRGDTDEPHERAFLWNMLGLLWTCDNMPELIDLPFSEVRK